MYGRPHVHVEKPFTTGLEQWILSGDSLETIDFADHTFPRTSEGPQVTTEEVRLRVPNVYVEPGYRNIYVYVVRNNNSLWFPFRSGTVLMCYFVDTLNRSEMEEEDTKRMEKTCVDGDTR